MSIVRVSNLAERGLDVFHDRSEPSLLHYYEPEPGLFIAESPMIIQRALDAGYEPLCALVEDRSEEFVINTLEQSGLGLPGCDGLSIYAAPLEELKKITGFHLTRGILCAMRRKRLPALEEILCDARRVVILDRVMNPTNAGAIFRSAAALGMDAVLLTKGSTDPLYRRAARVSMGTVFQIPWTFLDSWPEDIGVLKEKGFTVAAMSLTDDSVSLRDVKVLPDDKIALVMGTEGPGLPPATVRACDISIRIPMAHGVDSLNVAAASAVAFWSIGS